VKFHPLSELFPLLEGKAFEELVTDIEINGVREPVLTYQGQILDGRNRWRACEAAHLEAPTVEYTGNAPLAHVISLNLHRRHLDDSQRAVVAAKIANMNPGRRAEGAAEHVSQEEAAAVMNVSRTQVVRAKRVLKKAPPEIVTAVETGRVSVAAAEAIADEPAEVQTTTLREGGVRAVKALAQKRRKERQAGNGEAKAPPGDRDVTTRNVRAAPARRALYLWREFLSLRLEPLQFVKVAGRVEAALLTRSVAKFFLEVGRLARPPRKAAKASRIKLNATRRKKPARVSAKPPRKKILHRPPGRKPAPRHAARASA
jgi:hypothetical protein